MEIYKRISEGMKFPLIIIGNILMLTEFQSVNASESDSKHGQTAIHNILNKEDEINEE